MRSSEISNYFIGIDFVAVVVAVGSSVNSLSVSVVLYHRTFTLLTV